MAPYKQMTHHIFTTLQLFPPEASTLSLTDIQPFPAQQQSTWWDEIGSREMFSLTTLLTYCKQAVKH